MSKNFISQSDDIPTKMAQIQDLTKQVEDKYKKELETYELKVSEAILKPKDWIKYPSTSNYKHCKWHVGGYNSDLFKTGVFEREVSTIQALDEWKEAALAIVDKFIKDCEEVVEQNKVIGDHNKLVREQVEAFMEEVGVGATYTHRYYKTSRSRKLTTETQRAGYSQDLDRLIGGASTPSLNRSNYTRGLEAKYEELRKKIVEKEQQEKKKKEEEEAVHKVALLRAKYTPDDTSSSYEDILEGILDKDKYLHLAHYLQENRNDWNDGYDYAETGLSNFSVDSPEDESIYNCISGLIENWDGDGRVFRDCEYDYGTLYGMVESKGLMVDYHKVVSLIDQW